MIDNAYTSDKFKFLGLAMSGSKVLAKVEESQGWGSKPVHMVDEAEVYSWLESTMEAIESGNNGKTVHKNREELRAAFDAIRTRKIQNGIPLDVKDPRV
jgi:hypothetical protein